MFKITAHGRIDYKRNCMPPKKLKVAIAGNPNSGKTTIFNNLTGTRHRVGNWPGVTVEKKEGFVSYKDFDITLVDLPGTYSLSAYSIEEVVARKFIVEESPDVVVNVLDASNLERNLYLSMQLIELGVKLVFVLNMVDTAENRGIFIDEKRFSELAGVQVVKTVGNKNKGLEDILEALKKASESEKLTTSRIRLKYGDEVEEEIKKIQSVLAEDTELSSSYPLRWLGVKLFERDKEVMQAVKSSSVGEKIAAQVFESQKHIESIYEDEPEAVIADHRYGFIHGLCKELLHKSVEERIVFSDKIDMLLTNRLLGIPIFFCIMWIMFKATFSVGEIPMGCINGVIAGIAGIIVFLPNILILFLFISFFEDTGYMARAAFIMDRVMHSIGLHGKSFIPLLMGFGCNVPAIMATRTVENKRDRILSILINPYISCNARLPIYILFAGAFFPNNADNVIFSIYMLGICVSIFSGMLFKKFLFKGEAEPFVMELPPYRLPSLKSTAIHMWDKGVVFVKKIWRVVMVGSVLIWFLGNFPRHIDYSVNYGKEIRRVEKNFEILAEAGRGSKKNLEKEKKEKIAVLINLKKAEHQEKTYIGRLGKFIEPVFAPLGFNWKNSVALICGFIAKEIVVSTHSVLFKMGEEQGFSHYAPYSLRVYGFHFALYAMFGNCRHYYPRNR